MANQSNVVSMRHWPQGQPARTTRTVHLEVRVGPSAECCTVVLERGAAGRWSGRVPAKSAAGQALLTHGAVGYFFATAAGLELGLAAGEAGTNGEWLHVDVELRPHGAAPLDAVILPRT